MPPKKKDEVLRIRLSDDFKKKVEDLAEKRDENVSVVVRDALREYIKKMGGQPSLEVLNERGEGVATKVKSIIDSAEFVDDDETAQVGEGE